ncbi:hypothetical protein [Pararhodonellum marinum]|nr:hypothetical protein [Pararhodonellum marinum]
MEKSSKRIDESKENRISENQMKSLKLKGESGGKQKNRISENRKSEKS